LVILAILAKVANSGPPGTVNGHYGHYVVKVVIWPYMAKVAISASRSPIAPNTHYGRIVPQGALPRSPFWAIYGVLKGSVL